MCTSVFNANAKRKKCRRIRKNNQFSGRLFPAAARPSAAAKPKQSKQRQQEKQQDRYKKNIFLK